jgi:hypothetical protein
MRFEPETALLVFIQENRNCFAKMPDRPRRELFSKRMRFRPERRLKSAGALQVQSGGKAPWL